MTEHTAVDLTALRRRSIKLVLSSQDVSGAYPASPTYPVYRYSWLRDGAFIADAMSRVGEIASATAFFGWCHDVLEERRDHIEDVVSRSQAGELIANDELLPARFTLDGSEGEEDWWDFQLDGYGTWLWALAAHLRRHDLDATMYRSSVELTGHYLVEFGRRACYDWWEEHADRHHTSTLAAVAAGLQAAGRTTEAGEFELAVREATTPLGSLAKWAGSSAVDGSLLSCAVPFGVIEPGGQIAEATYEQICSELLSSGVHRYLADTFYGGGEWLNLTAMLGWYEARTGRRELARHRLDWIAAQATPQGWLPEQVEHHALAPERIQEWVDRWGPVATPLLWSHAMFLVLDHELNDPEPVR